MKIFTFCLIAVASVSIFAKSTKVEVEGGDARRLIKLIQGFSNPEISGSTKTFSVETGDSMFNIKCLSTVVNGMQNEEFCTVELDNEYNNDNEIKVMPAKKFKNLIVVYLQPGKLQTQLESKLSLAPYESVKTNVLVPREVGGRTGSHPVLKISCDNSQNTCEVLLNVSEITAL